MKYKNFKSSLEFLISYGFEYTCDSETGKRESYKNRFGEIILGYKHLDPNDWVPQIYINTHNRQRLINIEQEYMLLGNKKIKKTFHMLHDIAKNSIVKHGKLFEVLIEPQYLNV